MSVHGYWSKYGIYYGIFRLSDLLKMHWRVTTLFPCLLLCFVRHSTQVADLAEGKLSTFNIFRSFDTLKCVFASYPCPGMTCHECLGYQ